MVAAHASPKIACDQPKYDFGTQISGSAITNRFMLKNEGDAPLEIIKIKNCCGVESSADPMIIPPGSNTVCTAVFTTRNREGAQNKQILLVTNDKKHLYFDLRMTGTLQKPVEFEPHFVRLKDLLSDTSVSATVHVSNLLKEDITLESISTTLSGFKTEVVQSTNNEWTVKLSSTPPLTEGNINGRILLHFSNGEVEVPVIGNVSPIIQTTPKQISVGSSAGTIKRELMLRSADGRDFELVTTDLINAEGDLISQKLSCGKWRIQLLLKPESITSAASLQIETSLDVCKHINILIESK